VGEGNESFNKFKENNFGETWGMNDTCTTENF
jgi:hypothetical protein